MVGLGVPGVYPPSWNFLRFVKVVTLAPLESDCEFIHCKPGFSGGGTWRIIPAFGGVFKDHPPCISYEWPYLGHLEGVPQPDP